MQIFINGREKEEEKCHQVILTEERKDIVGSDGDGCENQKIYLGTPSKSYFHYGSV